METRCQQRWQLHALQFAQRNGARRPRLKHVHQHANGSMGRKQRRESEMEITEAINKSTIEAPSQKCGGAQKIMKSRQKISLFLTSIILPLSLHAAIINVSTSSQLSSAVASANPGDTIVMA